MAKPFTMRLPDDLVSALDRLAHQNNTSRTEYIASVLQAHVSDNRPDVILGWLKRDRPGEVDERSEPDDPAESCRSCGRAITDSGWFAVVADGRVIGVFCGECATSE